MKWVLPSCFPIGAAFDVTVSDMQDAPLEGVQVVYGTQTKLTDSSGKAQLFGEKSKYIITASKDGYNPLTGKKIAKSSCGASTATIPCTTVRGDFSVEVVSIPYIGREFVVKVSSMDGNAINDANVFYSGQVVPTDEFGEALLVGEKG